MRCRVQLAQRQASGSLCAIPGPFDIQAWTQVITPKAAQRSINRVIILLPLVSLLYGALIDPSS
ncbi:hypothetical protein BCV70DRAFT_60972 [Testicularia cyperi]|uniref:Uncharacterized protein n=1 Tax=Testicularia cyperi TaxID=1882483 RepID=A0A317XWJ2_9BASI|nr:hypothetical protein BCV70DRAFT_60972 [Testicularia cyperi]